jgi:hypothetical protein
MAVISALRAGQRRARLEPSDDVHESSGSLAPGLIPIEAESAPQVVVLIHELKARGHDADNLDRPIVQLHDVSDHPGITAEIPLPQPVAEDRDKGSVWPIVLR